MNDGGDGRIHGEPKNLGEIQDEKCDGDDGFAGVGELGHDAVEAVASFEDAKYAFDGDAGAFIGAHLTGERGGLGGVAGRTPEGWSGEADAVGGAPLTIDAGAVNAVGVDGGWVVAVTGTVALSLQAEVAAFVEGRPAEAVEGGKAMRGAG